MREGLGTGICSMGTATSWGVPIQQQSLLQLPNGNLPLSASYFPLVTDFWEDLHWTENLLRFVSFITVFFIQLKSPSPPLKVSIALHLVNARFSLMPLAFSNTTLFFFFQFIISDFKDNKLRLLFLSSKEFERISGRLIYSPKSLPDFFPERFQKRFWWIY